MSTASFWAMAYGFAVGSAGTRTGEGGDPSNIALGAIALSLCAVPLAFLAAAAVSRKPDWPLAVLAAMGLSIAVGLPLLWFRNPLGSLLAGLAAGAVVALDRPPGMTWHHRVIAAAVITAMVLGGLAVPSLFVPTALLGPALPFTGMGLADLVAPRAGWVTEN